LPIWFQIAIALNLIYWSIFFFLLSRRRWTVAALIAGIFHMLFAAVVSVAPIRATLDPHYTNFGLGFIQVKGQAAAIPAALVLCWALSAAWLAVGKGKGRWMTAIAAGDTFLALNMGGSLLLGQAGDWTFQLGEYLTISGVAGLVILLFFFTGPFVASAIWAIRRTGSGGTTRGLAQKAEGEGRVAKDETKKVNGLRYSQSRA
jgi:hypothetical protein